MVTETHKHKADDPTNDPMIDPFQELYLAVNSHAEVIELHDDYMNKQAALLDILTTTIDELATAVHQHELVERYRAAVRELARPEIETAVAKSLDEREG
jgi:hypothetical protein